MTEREAFCAQARDDLKMFYFLTNPAFRVNRCHQLYYLQKSAEKWAKATMKGTYPFQHDGVVAPLIRRLSDDRQLFAIAANLEALIPTKLGQPNTEYPWQQPSGDFTAPVAFDYDSRIPLREAKQLARFLADRLHYQPKIF
jgi:hypothetical protein